MVEVDLLGAKNLIDASLPHLRGSAAPSITAIGSALAYTGDGAYAAIKCALISYVKWLRSEHPQLTLEIKRVNAEGDMVATHSHLTLEPGQPGRALADFFRLEDGKVVEHWDVIQEVPDTSANSHGMF